MKIDSVPRSGISPRPEAPARLEAAPPAQAVSLPVEALPGRSSRRPMSGRARWAVAIGLAVLGVIFVLVVRGVLRPFIWAAVVCYILAPLVNLVQQRLKVRRGVSVTAIIVVLTGVFVWSIAAAIPQLRSDISALAGSLSGINAYLTANLPNEGTPTILGIPVQVTSIIHSVQVTVADLPNIIFHNTLSVASDAVSTLLHVLTFLITTFYLLLDAPRLGAWLTRRLPAAARDEVRAVTRQVNTVLSEYLRAEVILILIMTLASWIAMTILGVHFALVLAPIVGFLEIFPIVGPIFAIGLVTIVAIIGPASFGLTHASFAVVVALIFFVLRQLEDYLVIPKVVGHAVKLHPVIILFSLLCGASIAGILGMFLAVPVTGALKVVGSYIYDRLVE